MLTSQFNFYRIYFKTAELLACKLSTHLLEADENAKLLQYTYYERLARDGWRNVRFITTIF